MSHIDTEGRCWVHKVANVLDKLPKRLQPRAKSHLHEIMRAEDQATALEELERFREEYEAKYPKANDIPALDGDPNAASAMAITGGIAWVLTAAAMESALEENHALALGIIGSLTQRIRRLVEQIEDLALRSVTARLARFLLEQRQNPSLSGPAVTWALIATHLGTTPETVSRALRTLEETGAIEFDRHRIIIRDGSLLRDIAML